MFACAVFETTHMLLQARDRFENVRGQSVANDTFIIGVERVTTDKDNVTICDGSTGCKSFTWCKDDHSEGRTTCESQWDHQETEVFWKWQPKCEPEFDVETRLGCYNISFMYVLSPFLHVLHQLRDINICWWRPQVKQNVSPESLQDNFAGWPSSRQRSVSGSCSVSSREWERLRIGKDAG